MPVAQLPLKPFKTFEEQLEILRGRGLSIDDDPYALGVLARVGYYRLAGYFYPLRRPHPAGTAGRQDAFVDGASLSLVVGLYDFDRKLRLLVLDAIERIEVAIRVRIAYRLGRVDPEAHLNRDLLDGRFCRANGAGTSAHETWCARLAKALEDSRDDFAQHHRQKYDGRMPVWVAIELWDFGMLSRFFAGMQQRDRNAIAHSLGGLDGDHLRTWLRTLNFVRNVAAHHSRLWNRNVPEIPKMPRAPSAPLLEHVTQWSAHTRLYGALACTRYLLRAIHSGSDWHAQLCEQMESFPRSSLVSLSSAGFMNGWHRQPLWQ